MRVTIAYFIKNYSALADKALGEPMIFTENGRDRLVVLSADEYARLKQRDRRVVCLENFTDAEMAAITATDASAGLEHLNDGLQDWKP